MKVIYFHQNFSTPRGVTDNRSKIEFMGVNSRKLAENNFDRKQFSG